MLTIKGFGWGVKSMLWTYTAHSWYTGTTSQLVFSQRSPSHPSHKHQVPVSPFFTAQKRSKTIRLVHTARGGFALIWPSVFSWVVKLWLAPQTHLGPTPCQGCSCSIQSQIRKNTIQRLSAWGLGVAGTGWQHPQCTLAQEERREAMWERIGKQQRESRCRKVSGWIMQPSFAMPNQNNNGCFQTGIIETHHSS